MSRRIAAHSMTKTCETAVSPPRESSRRTNEPRRRTDMSIAAWPSIEPATARSACSRASEQPLAQ